MSYSTDLNHGQPIYTSSGIDTTMMAAQHHINFIPVPLTNNVDTNLPNTGIHSVQSNNFAASGNAVAEPRPKPQIMLLERMKQLRDEGKYCDLFIDVKGMRFFAHKSLLAAWSPYFDEALTCTNYIEKDLLIVHYDSYEVFADLLEFFYTGNVLPRDTNFLQLLHLAVSFNIDLLKSYCEEFLRCNLHLGNCISTYFLSRKYSLESLEEFIAGFLQSNLSDTVKQSEFLQMKAEKFHALLSKGSMLKLKPEIKLFLVISWVGFDVQVREKFLVLLLKHIDWSTVASDFLFEISHTENFFTTHESSLYLLLQTLYSSGIPLGPYNEMFDSLRQTYSYLLSEVVHSGVILAEKDDFVPVTVTGTSTRTIKLDVSVNTDVPVYDSVSEMQSNSAHISDLQPNSAITVIPDRQLNSANTVTPDLHSNSAHIDNNYHPQSFSEEVKDPYGVTEDTKDRPDYSEDNQKKDNIVSKELHNGDEFTPRKSKRVQSRKKTKTMEMNKLDLVPTSNQLHTSRKLPVMKEEKEVSIDNGKLEYKEDSTDSLQEALEGSDDQEDEDYKPYNDDGMEQDNEDEKEIFDIENEMKILKEETGKKSESGIHKRRPKTKPQKKFDCPYCKYRTVIESRFHKHVKLNHENDVELKCTICNGYVGKSNRNFSEHMKTHFHGPPFTCEVFQCDYTTDKFHTLLIHRMKHADTRPYPCDICGARFRTRNNVYAHLKTHTGQKPFKCPHCPKTFALKNTLDQHLVTHDDLRPYLCDLCGFATKYQSHLTAHKRTHTGDLFKCDHPKCNYETPKRSQLKCHMRIHLGIRSFTCGECGKSFIEKSHLKRHETIHLADKPFKCILCDYATTRKDKLKYHMEKNHEPGSEKQKKRPQKGKKKQGSKEESASVVIPDAFYVHTATKNLDHAAYTIQGISTDGTNSISLDDFRRAQLGGNNLDGITIQVPVSMEHLVLPLDDPKLSSSRSLTSTSPDSVTPVTLIPEDHQMYIQNVMTQVPMTTIHQQQPQHQTQGVPQNQDYGGLGAFMTLFQS